MKVGLWSTTPGSNNTTPPDGWPEGQAPSTVNDCAREMMAQIRTVFNDPQYFDAGLVPTFVNATNFTVPGNQTFALHIGRRLKIFDATAGVATVLYATVTNSVFGAVTTVTVANDAGQLTSSLSSFAFAILSLANDSLPRGLNQSFNRISASAAEITGVLSVGGAAAVNGAFSVGGAATFGTTLSVSGAAAVNGALSVGGVLLFASKAGGLKASLSAANTHIHLTGAAGTGKYVDLFGNQFRVVNAANTLSLLTIDESGNGVFTGNVTAFSDESLKTHWQPLAPNFLEKLAEIKSGTYDRIDTGANQAGVSAQDLKEVLPQAVHGEEGQFSVAYGNAAMVAVVELTKEVLRLRELLKKVLP